MSDRLARTLDAAIAQGLLPPDAVLPAQESRPWPVVLLMGLGAWLAAIPLIATLGLLLDDFIERGPGAYVAGVPILLGAAATLRARGLPLFVEQLAFPGLLVGLGTLAFGLGRDLPDAAAAAVLAALCLVLAALIPRPWLRALLGAGAAGLATWAMAIGLRGHLALLAPEGSRGPLVWLALHAALAVWLAGSTLQTLLCRGETARAAAALEPIGAGWLAAVLAGLAAYSGMTMLAGAALSPGLRELAQWLAGRSGVQEQPVWMPAASALLTLAATRWGARVWPALGQPWVLGAGLCVAALAWLLPSLGGVWLALVLTATAGRPRLAGAALLAAVWIIGSFYYRLDWPLAHKGLFLIGIGIALGALVWLGSGRLGALGRHSGEASPSRSASADTGPLRVAPWLVGLAAVATLAVTNLGIWRNETLIAQGQPVFVELAPVDPRSLMQGDFMRLRFRMPPGMDGVPTLGTRHPLAVAHRDGRGVATLSRLHRPGEPLADGELLVELTPKDGRWTLASDAWFFREGDAALWEKARYGEFRVTQDGRALLVGLADRDLRAISPGEGSARPATGR